MSGLINLDMNDYFEETSWLNTGGYIKTYYDTIVLYKVIFFFESEVESKIDNFLKVITYLLSNDIYMEYSIRILLQLCFIDALKNDFIVKRTHLIGLIQKIYAESNDMHCECILRKLGILINNQQMASSLNNKAQDTIFINHDAGDLSYAHEIACFLEQLGLKVYFNSFKQSTYDFEKIYRIIRSSYCFLIGKNINFDPELSISSCSVLLALPYL